jgi:alanine dehydrogenase
LIVGIPKETKNHETRVAITPEGVDRLFKAGHLVLIEKGAGAESGFADEAYALSGATLANTAQVWAEAELIVKVKEPLPGEYEHFRRGLILFSFLHLAANEPLRMAFADAGVRALAYEGVELADGSLPLLAPMSAIAGRLAAQIGAHYLLKTSGGLGLLLSGIPGTPKSKVVIVGAGTVGTSAAASAIGLGARVIVLDTNPSRLEALEERFGGRLELLMSNPDHLGRAMDGTALLIGAVLLHGEKAPKVITTEMVRRMSKGGVVVDVAIDQGGSVESLEAPTTHDEPVVERLGVLHYAVPNMPALTPMTSTPALTARSLPYIFEIAIKGLEGAVSANPALKKALVVS